MNSKIRRFLIVGLCALTLLLSGTAIVNLSNNRVVAESPRVWSDISLADAYVQGDDVTIPERTLTYLGETVKASVTVTLPNGATTSNTNIKLTIAGKYTVIYTAVIGGRVYSRRKPLLLSIKW